MLQYHEKVFSAKICFDTYLKIFHHQPNRLTFLFFFFPSLQTIMPKIFAILLVQAAVFSPAVAKEGEREIFNLRGKQEEEALRNVR